MRHLYLSLGTNLGNKEENIAQAICKIEEQIGKVVSSDNYYTKPVGFVSDNDFLNIACLVYTNLSAMQILLKTQSIEKEIGRSSKSVNHTYADRIIDIDLLMIDDEVINNSVLTLPHPEMHKRLFVLEPLADIASDVIHPTLGLSIKQLKENLVNGINIGS